MNEKLVDERIRKTSRTIQLLNVALCLLLCPPSIIFGFQGNDWRYYGGNQAGQRYSTLRQVNRTNVRQLRPAWVFHTGEKPTFTNPAAARQSFECTPLVIRGTLYLSTPGNRLFALNPETGSVIWQFDPHAYAKQDRQFKHHRGVAYWEGPTGEPRIFIGTFDGRLIGVSTRTGKPIDSFGKRGEIDLRAGVADKWPQALYSVNSPPLIYKNLVIVGAELPEGVARGPSGAIRAWNVLTGKLIWEFDTVRPIITGGQTSWGDESWKDRTGVNVWSMMSVDEDRGLLFLPTGSASYDFYGGDRPGLNLFANSLIALDANTGTVRWFYQLVHHDLWDYDLPAQPILFTAFQNGKKIPAVVQLTKMGLVFSFNRTNGMPLFPIEERAVPQSDVPGEESWPTQPFPIHPPPLSRQKMSSTEINVANETVRNHCEGLLASLTQKGPYTPFGSTSTLVFPGTTGGATWGGGSFDPKSSILYVNTNELGAIGIMKPTPLDDPIRYRRQGVESSIEGTSEATAITSNRFAYENFVPCQAPPWGVLTAINLNSGRIVWKVPLGNLPEYQTEPSPPTGAPNIGGSIVTAGGLIFIAATADQKFRAFDSSSGKELWATDLEASGFATPITYYGTHKQRQFVAVATGGGGIFKGPISDVFIAYSLP